MLLTHTKRIIRTGFVNFWRNSFLSFSAIIAITLFLTVFGGMIFASAFGRALIKEVKNKVDINVYFVLNAAEADVFEIQKTIQSLPEVDKVEYISREQALSDFREKWKDNALIIQGLEEIGSNPFPAVLNIKAKEPSQYAGIVSFLDKKDSLSGSADIIDKINYNQNKLVIDRLGRIIPAVEKTGSIIAIIFVIVAIILVFNTIRLIIFTSREEISVMRLVGASNFYIRGPFVVSGIMYGVFSGIVTLFVLAGLAFYSNNLLAKLFTGGSVTESLVFSNTLINFSSYFVQNFGEIFALIMGAGIILGGVSSYLSVKRYLRI